jgi:hypothetical protein
MRAALSTLRESRYLADKGRNSQPPVRRVILGMSAPSRRASCFCE